MTELKWYTRLTANRWKPKASSSAALKNDRVKTAKVVYVRRRRLFVVFAASLISRSRVLLWTPVNGDVELNRNPIPIVLPCHRVVGANGSLTGYGGGLDRKEWLLRHEGWLPEKPARLPPQTQPTLW